MIVGDVTLTANHVAAEYAAMSPITLDVHFSEHQGYYFNHAELGCSRPYSVLAAGARIFLSEHGFKNPTVLNERVHA